MGRRWVSRLLRKAIMAVAGALVVPAVPLHAHGMESFWAIWEPCPSSFSGFGMRFEEFHGRITEHFRQKSKAEIDEIFMSDSEEGDALRLFAPVVVEPMEMAIFHLDCWADYRRFMRNSELEQLGQAHESYLRWRYCLQDAYRYTPLPKGFTLISSCYESIGHRALVIPWRIWYPHQGSGKGTRHDDSAGQYPGYEPTEGYPVA